MARSNGKCGVRSVREMKRSGVLLEQMGQPQNDPNVRREKRRNWQQNECQGLFDFKPTEWQEEFLDVIENHKITLCDSVAGVGKSATALYYACREYLTDPTKKIVFVRTPAEVGFDRLGFLPGEANMQDKLGPHFESTKVLIEQFIGKAKFEADLNKRILLTVPNFCLGATRENCIYLLDEVQLLQPLILKLLLERIGQDTKTIVMGSSGQLYADAKGRNAMRDARKRFFNEDGSKKYKDIGFYKFPVEAVMRDSVVMDVIRAYEDENA